MKNSQKKQFYAKTTINNNVFFSIERKIWKTPKAIMPSKKKNNSIDLAFIEKVCSAVHKQLKHNFQFEFKQRNENQIFFLLTFYFITFESIRFSITIVGQAKNLRIINSDSIEYSVSKTISV